MRRLRQSQLIPLITIVIGALLIGIALIFGFSSGIAPSSATVSPPQESEDVTRISIDEAKRAYDSEEAIFVDVRDVESFRAGHIPGAISIPLNELSGRIDELSVGALIIPY